jgi:AraC-like DNA-binding protein
MIARSDPPDALDHLGRLIERHATGFGTPTGVDRQVLVGVDDPGTVADLRYVPMLCFVARGAKRLLAGDKALDVSRGEVFVGLIDAPVTATFTAPYRAVTLVVDDRVLAGLLVESSDQHRPAHSSDYAFSTATMDPRLIDAVTRWVALNDEPGHAGFLGPRIEEELLYRVLTGPLGGSLSAMMRPGHAATVRAAAAYLAENLALPVSLAELAAAASCSPVTLAKHFRRVTGTSPLQFHKQLKLQRARQLLATGSHTAASAAAAVGYLSPSQFNRDYRRRYGTPPLRHARMLTG